MSDPARKLPSRDAGRKSCQRCHTRKAPAYICVACSNYIDEQSRKKIEIRLNDDGTLDEIVSRGFHLEQMAHNHWWMRIGPIVVSFYAKSQRITVRADNQTMGDPKERNG